MAILSFIYEYGGMAGFITYSFATWLRRGLSVKLMMKSDQSKVYKFILFVTIVQGTMNLNDFNDCFIELAVTM